MKPCLKPEVRHIIFGIFSSNFGGVYFHTVKQKSSIQFRGKIWKSRVIKQQWWNMSKFESCCWKRLIFHTFRKNIQVCSFDHSISSWKYVPVVWLDQVVGWKIAFTLSRRPKTQLARVFLGIIVKAREWWFCCFLTKWRNTSGHQIGWTCSSRNKSSYTSELEPLLKSLRFSSGFVTARQLIRKIHFTDLVVVVFFRISVFPRRVHHFLVDFLRGPLLLRHAAKSCLTFKISSWGGWHCGGTLDSHDLMIPSIYLYPPARVKSNCSKIQISIPAFLSNV